MNNKPNPKKCDECGGTGICGERKAELRARITVLEDALNELYHRTDCTTWQMEIINRASPQKP